MLVTNDDDVGQDSVWLLSLIDEASPLQTETSISLSTYGLYNQWDLQQQESNLLIITTTYGGSTLSYNFCHKYHRQISLKNAPASRGTFCSTRIWTFCHTYHKQIFPRREFSYASLIHSLSWTVCHTHCMSASLSVDGGHHQPRAPPAELPRDGEGPPHSPCHLCCVQSGKSHHKTKHSVYVSITKHLDLGFPLQQQRW